MKKRTEFEQLTAGLTAARKDVLEDVDREDDFKMPDEILNAYASIGIAEIREQIAEAKALGVVATIRLGFAYMGLKVKLKGRFKSTLIAEEGESGYMRAWRAMCRAQAFLRVPEVAERLGQRDSEKILSLSAEEVLALRARLIGASPEVAKRITEEALDRLDDDRKYRKARHAALRQREKNVADEEDEKLEAAAEPSAEVVPSKLAILVAKAAAVLYEIYDAKIPEAEWPQCRKYFDMINKAHDHAAYTLNDPTHRNPPWWETAPSAADFADDNEAAARG